MELCHISFINHLDMKLSFSAQQLMLSPIDHQLLIQAFAKQSTEPKPPSPKEPDPNWPSTKPGNPSGPGRDNNPPKRK